MAPSRSYADFKSEVWDGTFENEEFIAFDIAAYFNGVYHHDLHAWFGRIGASNDDVEALGKFLREINAGRSLDCLPQGLYPAKMIGNDFLRFIEDFGGDPGQKDYPLHGRIYLFDDDINVLRADFAEVQRLLGLKGLSVNASKTQSGGTPSTDKADDEISDLKKRLLKRRRHLIVSHYDDDFSSHEPDDEGEGEGDEALTEAEIEYVASLLNDRNIREEDAELILIVMRDNVERIEQHLALFAHGFPHLAKNFFGLCGDAKDKEAVAQIVLDVVGGGEHIGEYQLFWFGVMLEHYLIDTRLAPELINVLYRHESATDVSKAKILEIPDHRYGLSEMREAFLREGRSDWLAGPPPWGREA